MSYKMVIDVDAENRSYSGAQELVYTNNSSDTISRVFYHLYFNAFKPGSEMQVRASEISDDDRTISKKILSLKKKDFGDVRVLELLQDGFLLELKNQETILEAALKNPLLPGEKTTLSMRFEVDVPKQVRRAGKDSDDGIDFSMAQWYPKLCEYDSQGWHANAYLGREFYGVWGDFDVTIKIDKEYIVAGSGYLQESDPSNFKLGVKSGKKRIWNFLAPKVHDFTWAADPDYIHDIFEGENGVKLNFYYKNDPEIIENWKALQPITGELLKFFNKNIGIYPYKQYSVVQGGDGGMEYSMLTLVNSGKDFIPLVSVTSHELAHAWFQGVLATNEMNHEWMDEGSASYFGDLAESFVLGSDFYNSIRSSYGRYISLANSGQEMPQSTNANRYKHNRAYESTAYSKGFVFLSQLRYIIGLEAFNKTIKNYFDTYKFTHPLPNDLRRIAEQSSGILLNWYLTDWTKTTNKIDYAINQVEKVKNKSLVTLERIGLMPMPLEVLVTLKDGTKEFYYIPIPLMRGEKKQPEYAENWIQLRDWSWASKKYIFEINHKLESIISIDTNPTGLMADTDYSNDIITFE